MIVLRKLCKAGGTSNDRNTQYYISLRPTVKIVFLCIPVFRSIADNMLLFRKIKKYHIVKYYVDYC